MKFKYRNAAHYIAGIITACSYLLSPALPITGLVVFVIYELNEDWHLHDKAYHDILEFMVAFFATVAGLIIWEVIYA